MKYTFIFGAGASKEAGGPLMTDFLQQADKLSRLREDVVAGSQEAFDNVFSAISELQGVHAKSYLNLDNLEAVFGAIEMGVLLRKFGDREPEGIDKLRQDFVTLIFKTLECLVEFPSDGKRVLAPPPYGKFITGLPKKQSEIGRLLRPEYSFITFNYDVALDYALHWNQVGFDYGLQFPKIAATPLLKLHGSINWGECPECHEIVPIPVRLIHPNGFHPDEPVRFYVGSSLPSTSHCKSPLRSAPVIVPPTWNKTVYHAQISNVWRHAAKVLSESENIFVIGYSLPSTDAFFRYLYALGTQSKTRIQRFWVFDPDSNQEVEPRFRDMIGRGIEGKFKFHRLTFAKAIPVIEEAIKSM
jgi:hypothetical protein